MSSTLWVGKLHLQACRMALCSCSYLFSVCSCKSCNSSSVCVVGVWVRGCHTARDPCEATSVERHAPVSGWAAGSAEDQPSAAPQRTSSTASRVGQFVVGSDDWFDRFELCQDVVCGFAAGTRHRNNTYVKLLNVAEQLTELVWPGKNWADVLLGVEKALLFPCWSQHQMWRWD